MYKSHAVIDTHGHISTPPQFRAYAYNLIVLRNAKEPLVIPDDAMRPALDPKVGDMVDALRTAALRFEARRDSFAQGKGLTCRDIADKLVRFGTFASDKQEDFARKLVEWSLPRQPQQQAQAPAGGVGAVTCGKCGAKTAPGKFCAECGQALAEKKQFCSECGKPMVSGTKFCGECGAKQGG